MKCNASSGGKATPKGPRQEDGEDRKRMKVESILQNSEARWRHSPEQESTTRMQAVKIESKRVVEFVTVDRNTGRAVESVPGN